MSAGHFGITVPVSSIIVCSVGHISADWPPAICGIRSYSNADQSMAIHRNVARQRSGRCGRYYCKHCGQPSHLDRCFLQHLLPLHGLPGLKRSLPTFEASQQHQGSYCKLRRLSHSDNQLVHRNVYPCHLRRARRVHGANAQFQGSHRTKLTQEVQAKLRAQDSVTCRSCHDANAIKPVSESGRTSHAMLKQGGVTCVDCHTNLVHPPAAQSSRLD